MLTSRVASSCLGYFVYLFQNQELNDHAGNLITICLMHEWRRKGADSVIIGALFGTDVSSSQYRSSRRSSRSSGMSPFMRLSGSTCISQARRPVEYPWSEGQAVSFLELQLYTMRHVQEHAAQLNLFLGQHGSSVASDWGSRAKADEGG
jgi:hypothetical protein